MIPSGLEAVHIDLISIYPALIMLYRYTPRPLHFRICHLLYTHTLIDNTNYFTVDSTLLSIRFLFIDKWLYNDVQQARIYIVSSAELETTSLFPVKSEYHQLQQRVH